MSEKLVLALDQGTTSSRSIVFDKNISSDLLNVRIILLEYLISWVLPLFERRR